MWTKECVAHLKKIVTTRTERSLLDIDIYAYFNGYSIRNT